MLRFPGLQRYKCLANTSRMASVRSYSFLSGEGAGYAEAMYESWKQDPKSVHASWNAYFSNLEKGVANAFTTAPNVAEGTRGSFSSIPASNSSAFDSSRVVQLIRGYQTRGHEFAKTNPLGLPSVLPFVTYPRAVGAQSSSTLTLQDYNLSDKDLDAQFDLRVPGMSGFLSPEKRPQSLRTLIQRLDEAYCGDIGFEYMHISDRAVCNYFREKIETPEKYRFTDEERRKILLRTARSQMFENFCATKFSTAKRFGLDGCETMIVGLKSITKNALKYGVESIVMGMPHRGRLNVLMNVMHKPMEQMMSEFQGVTGFGGTEWGNTGDVKYHLGVEYEYFDEKVSKYLKLSLLPNPSHLEAVNPLVAGLTRSQQYFLGDNDRTKVLPIILHGDAAIAGQGVVYETTQMSLIPNYAVGGTIHVVVNNQVGFTTDPKDSGSGKYCTDLAKSIDAPILHVNADNPEAVTFAFELALDYRQKYHADIFIDLIGYRRLGHNELDMPKFTQPKMYSVIDGHKSVLDLYSQKLLDEKVLTSKDIEDIKSNILTFYNAEYEKSKSFTPKSTYDHNLSKWKNMKKPNQLSVPRATGVSLNRIKDLGTLLSTLPENFTAHPAIAKIFKQRLQAMSSGEEIDFGMGEILAYGTLLQDGYHIRLGGQDVQRGTFSHRHAVVHDQKTYNAYNVFSALASPYKFEACNSLLSEYAAMGYELGYSMDSPETLSIWEAQFGDFFNGAQIIVDQFITSAESKWGYQSGIVLRLPHGYDGQGPEHSSARIERFLQACDDREDVIDPENWNEAERTVVQQHNMQVVNCTTPSQEFHVIRRQMHRDFRKPLIMFSPKKMLKMRSAFSKIQEFDENSSFMTYIPEVDEQIKQNAGSIKRLILCSGQVYYDLMQERQEKNLTDVAIARVEQLSPFPYEKVIDDIKKYSNVESIVWAQEEPMNMGPWSYVSKRLENSIQYALNGKDSGLQGLKRDTPIYAGRDVSSSPAVGDSKLHQQQSRQLLSDAFNKEKLTHSYFELHQSNQ